MPLGSKLVVFASAVIVACSSTSSDETAKPGACSEPSCESCPEGMAREEATGACVDVLPTDACAAGTGPFLGRTACEPVGWTDCAPPFERDPSGWGCRPVVAEACPRGTIGVLGSASCKPIGDCSAPFPPANATVFVDASLTTEDAKHFKSIFSAVAGARPGDIVAVSPGTYVEDVDIARSNLTIVGKCAAEVVLENPGDKRAGILVTEGARGAKVRGLTLRGHYTGMLVRSGGEGTLEDSIVEKSRYLGLYAAEAKSSLRVVRTRVDDVVPEPGTGKFGWGAAAQLGATISLEDVTIDAATTSGITVGGAGSKGTFSRVVVRSPRASAVGYGAAISVVDRGAATLDGALFDDLTGVGVQVDEGSLEAKHIHVRRSKALGEGSGRGVQVIHGGTLQLAESLVADNEEVNVVVLDKGSRATITKSTIRSRLDGDGSTGDMGVFVGGPAEAALDGVALVANVEKGLALQDGAKADVARTLIAETQARKGGGPKNGHLGYAVTVSSGSTLAMSDSALVRNREAAMIVTQADASGVPPRATLTKTVVLGTLPSPSGEFGRGLQVSLRGVVNLEGCAFKDNSDVSILVGGPAEVALASTVIRGTKTVQDRFGHGIVADVDSALTIDRAWLLDHAGVALAVAGGGATVKRSVVARSTVGIVTQGGTSLVTGDEAPTAPEPNACFVTNDTRFVDNQTRVGAGAIPLPNAIGDTPRKTSAK